MYMECSPVSSEKPKNINNEINPDQSKSCGEKRAIDLFQSRSHMKSDAGYFHFHYSEFLSKLCFSHKNPLFSVIVECLNVLDKKKKSKIKHGNRKLKIHKNHVTNYA